MMGLPASGRHFRVPAVFLYELRAGRRSRERRIYDFTGMLIQIGVLKALACLKGRTMTRADIASCSNHESRPSTTMTCTRSAPLYADDAVVESPLGVCTRAAPQSAGVVDVFLAALSDATFTGDHLIIDGDRVVQVFTLSGTDTGGLMGMAPSGRPAQLPMVIVCRVADGLVVHERRIYDFTGMLVQIGVLKAKPA